MNIFIDTSAFVAYTDRTDANHDTAKEFLDSLAQRDRLHTSNYILDETITRLRFTLGHAQATTFAETILADPVCRVHYIDAAAQERALKVFKKFRDQRLSFTDCSTVSLVRDLGLDAVFAFDEDFSRVGLRTLP